MASIDSTTTPPQVPKAYFLISENAVMLEWQAIICSTQHQSILRYQQHLNHKFNALIIDSLVSYHTLMIYYDFDHQHAQNFIRYLGGLLNQEIPAILASNKDNKQHTIKKIPVLYDTNNNWDLENVARKISLTVDEVISIHSKKNYRAYALGFTPGFCYLGTLAPALHCPRLDTPRLKVPKGAVAIAEQQTAVYPNSSPGGWHIIGRTPQDMCNTLAPNTEFTPYISVGDTIQFIPIGKEEFASIENEQATHNVGALC